MRLWFRCRPLRISNDHRVVRDQVSDAIQQANALNTLRLEKRQVKLVRTRDRSFCLDNRKNSKHPPSTGVSSASAGM